MYYAGGSLLQPVRYSIRTIIQHARSPRRLFVLTSNRGLAWWCGGPDDVYEILIKVCNLRVRQRTRAEWRKAQNLSIETLLKTLLRPDGPKGSRPSLSGYRHLGRKGYAYRLHTLGALFSPGGRKRRCETQTQKTAKRLGAIASLATAVHHYSQRVRVLIGGRLTVFQKVAREIARQSMHLSNGSLDAKLDPWRCSISQT
ncbi:hypothetical protein C8Q74DRAFT_506955 [Fomes fomentarius]|nr:hypothetical protein C8Q74DRAFT_506955 [Fomes fomentarius]